METFPACTAAREKSLFFARADHTPNKDTLTATVNPSPKFLPSSHKQEPSKKLQKNAGARHTMPLPPPTQTEHKVKKTE